MSLLRFVLLACMTALLPALAAGQTQSQSQPGAAGYPDRPIRLVVPFPPGGGVDIVGRLVGKRLSEALGQPVIIDNKPGAGAIIGSEFVAKSAPDGYTLLMGSASALTINQSLYKTLPYDPAAHFVAVGLVANTPGVLAVNPKVPANTLQDLIRLAKAKPGKMTYASSGNGNFQHLLAELFKAETGIDILHVPYKGSAPALADTVAGQVDMVFDVIPSAAPLIESGKLRGLAVSTARRSAVLPNVPTMDEAGVKGFDASSWYGVVAPAGTPKAVVDRLSAAIAEMARSPEMQADLLKVGAAPLGEPASAFAAFLKSESARWAKLIKANNIAPD